MREGDHVYLQLTLDDAVAKAKTTLVTTGLLGKTVVAGLPYEQPDGSPLCVNSDYFGRSRDKANPTPGPFQNPGTGRLKLEIR